ncbi:MAG: hypothetical protein Fur0034_05330 [Desulfuromonadia bacterium]
MKRFIVAALLGVLIIPRLSHSAKPLLKPVPPKEPVRVSSLLMEPRANGYELQGDSPLRYEAYSMPQILRFVLDMTNMGDSEEIPVPPPVTGVWRVVVQRKEINFLPIRRIILDLKPGYEGRAFSSPDGKRITITVTPSTNPADTPPSMSLQPVVPAVSSRPLPSRPVNRLDRIEIMTDGIGIVTKKPVTPHAVFTLSAPPRLVIDLPPDAVTLPRETVVGRFGVRRVRSAISPDKVRIVLDADGSSFPPYRVQRRPDSLLIRFTGVR